MSGNTQRSNTLITRSGDKSYIFYLVSNIRLLFSGVFKIDLRPALQLSIPQMSPIKMIVVFNVKGFITISSSVQLVYYVIRLNADSNCPVLMY